MRLAAVLQIIGFAGFPAGAFMLWGAGWAVLTAACCLVLVGVLIEVDARKLAFGALIAREQRKL